MGIEGSRKQAGWYSYRQVDAAFTRGESRQVVLQPVNRGATSDAVRGQHPDERKLVERVICR